MSLKGSQQHRERSDENHTVNGERKGSGDGKAAATIRSPRCFCVLLPSPLQCTVAAAPALLGTPGWRPCSRCAHERRDLQVPGSSHPGPRPGVLRRSNSEVLCPSGSAVQNIKQATYAMWHFSSSHIKMNPNVFYLHQVFNIKIPNEV